MLCARFPDVFPTPSRAKKACRCRRVFVDGVRASTTLAVAPGQLVQVRNCPLAPTPTASALRTLLCRFAAELHRALARAEPDNVSDMEPDNVSDME